MIDRIDGIELLVWLLGQPSFISFPCLLSSYASSLPGLSSPITPPWPPSLLPHTQPSSTNILPQDSGPRNSQSLPSNNHRNRMSTTIHTRGFSAKLSMTIPRRTPLHSPSVVATSLKSSISSRRVGGTASLERNADGSHLIMSP